VEHSVVEYPDLGVQVVKGVRIPMEDGVRLAGDLYMPLGAALDGSERYACVLEYIPYRKDDVGKPTPSRWYAHLPQNSYVVARVDCRGTGASEGVSTDEYTPQEQRDGYTTVEWLAGEPWCDRHVNMIGISYGGFTSVQVAALQPPHLTSIVPVAFTDNRYTDDVHYKGGLLRMWCDPGFYSGFMIPFNALPPDPGPAGEDWARLWEEHVQSSQAWLLEWLRHQVDGPYWRSGSVGDVADRIKCPVFMVAGWWDAYPSCALRLTQTLTAPWKLLVGPWDHALPDNAVPGPRIDYLPEVVRWLDHWCKGADNGVMDEPPVVVYMQRHDEPVVDLWDKSGAWRAERGWPPPGQVAHTLHLAGDGRLSEEPASEGSDELRYDARVGVTRGLVQGGQPLVLPVDQRLDEVLGLAYTSEPLEEDLTVLGWPRATIQLATTASVMPIAAALAEVTPDGTSALVCKGVVNLTRRSSLTDPEPVVPGERMEIDVELQATGWTFAKGNRIRLALASGDFPELWPTPETGTTTIYRGGDSPSRLVLPVVPAEGSAEAPEFAPSQLHPRAARQVTPRIWAVTDDLVSGVRSVQIGFDAVPGQGARTAVDITCRVDPRRPAAASLDANCTVARTFEGLVAEGRSKIIIQGTESHFQVSIDLEVLANGAHHASRRWVESIPRVLL